MQFQLRGMLALATKVTYTKCQTVSASLKSAGCEDNSKPFSYNGDHDPHCKVLWYAELWQVHEHCIELGIIYLIVIHNTSCRLE